MPRTPRRARDACRRRVKLALPALLAIATLARAERLPVRRFTTADGLPSDRVEQILLGSRGFLWFATSGGLARYDGRRFRTYGTADGLLHESIEAIVEDDTERFWVATWGGGVYRFDPTAADSASLFTRLSLPGGVASERVHSLVLGRASRLWAGTLHGLYSLDLSRPDAGFERVPLIVSGREVRPRIWQMAEDRSGTLWMATPVGLLRRGANGRVVERPVVPGASVHSNLVFEDRRGRIWVGHLDGITSLVPGTPDHDRVRFVTDRPVVSGAAVEMPRKPGESMWYAPFGRPGPGRALGQDRDGGIWLGQTGRGLAVLGPGGARTFDPESGLGPDAIAFAQDRAGNLWFGTLDAGAVRLAAAGFTAFGVDDGLDYEGHVRLTLGRDGEPVVVASSALYVFEAGRFRPVRPRVPASAAIEAALQDRDRRWWIGTSEGLFRVDRARRASDLEALVPEAIELPGARRRVSLLFEDSRGDLWVGTEDPPGLLRRDPSTGDLRPLERDGFPRDAIPRSIVEDASTTIWVTAGGALYRCRDGRFSRVAPRDSDAERVIVDVAADRRGRLWVAAGPGGLFRIDDPGSEDPRPVPVATPTAFLGPVTVGGDGRVWVGTQAGVLEVDPDGGAVRRYTTAEGLSGNEVERALAAPDGTVWLASRVGISRLVPAPASDPPPAPPVRIESIRIAGEPYPVPDVGALEIAGPTLGPNTNSVRVGYAGIHFAAGGPLRYQHRLVGATQGWTEPTAERAVSLASLAPGRYRFEVRAIDPAGRVSPRAAGFSFRILPPLYMRGWFVAVCGLLLGSAAYGAHRYRLRRHLELERVRTRVARDLHDELGTSLSRISILGEVVRREMRNAPARAEEAAAQIAGTARDLVDAAGDVVWSVDPRRDDLGSLVTRLRRFASDVLDSRGIAWSLDVPGDLDRIALGPEARLNLYLVLKEAVSNAARHAGASRVAITIRAARGAMRGGVTDDGTGIAGERAEARDGHGLSNMAARAESAGGRLEVSTSAAGTTVRVVLPLRR